jgi:hypothetical protein
VLFNSKYLAAAAPSPALVELCCLLVGLYAPEHAPVLPDTIYLDSLPLRRPDGTLELFTANITVFFTGAHLTAMHDHRCPGGVLFNLNGVGHYTYCQLDAGRYPTLEEALKRSHRSAIRSVGTGGIGRRHGVSPSVG